MVKMYRSDEESAEGTHYERNDGVGGWAGERGSYEEAKRREKGG